MADPRLVTVNDYTSSVYADLADQTDVLLSDILVAAEEEIERTIGYSLLAATYVETYKAKSQVLFVLHRPIQSVTLIRRRGSRLSAWYDIPSYNYIVEKGPAYIDIDSAVTGWDVEVTYIAGFDETPASIKSAVILQAALNLTVDLELYGAGDSKEPGTAYMYNHIKRLIAPYKQSVTPYR